MEYNVFKRRHHWSALVVLGTLILVAFIACFDRLSSRVQAQPTDTGAISQEGTTDKLPVIKEVVFYQQEDTSRYWIKQAQVVSTDGRFILKDTKILFTDIWQEWREYAISPDRTRLLVTRETGSSASRQESNLLVVSLPTGKTKTLRGDGAGYAMLGWSSDSKLISYVSPIILPYPLALSLEPPRFQLISYVSNQSTSPSYREPPDRFLYISAADGKWRRKVQAEVSNAVWIPGRRVIVYTSYEKPKLVVYSSDGKKAVLPKDKGGGQLLISGDGRKLLSSDGPKLLRLFEIPQDSSKLLDAKAWKTIAEFDLDPNRPTVAIGLSHDGKMVALRGPDIQTPIPGDGIQGSTRLAVLNFVTKKSVVYSLAGNLYRLGWSQDGRYLIGGYFQPSKNGESADLAAIRIDPSSITHTGPIDWDNPQAVTPKMLLEMPVQTRSITWSE